MQSSNPSFWQRWFWGRKPVGVEKDWALPGWWQAPWPWSWVVVPGSLVAFWGYFAWWALLLLPVFWAWSVLVGNDWRQHVLPDRQTFPLWWFSVLAVAILGWGRELAGMSEVSGLDFLRQAIGGAVIAFIGSAGLAIVSAGQGLGWGDVKLAPSLGLFLGVLGFSAGLFAALVAVVAAGLVAVMLLITRRGTIRSELAFSPYMVLGTCTAVLFFGG